MVEMKDPTFRDNVELIKHFRNQFAELSNERTLELLSISNLEPFTSKDARFVFKVTKQAISRRMSRLVQLGLLERKGHVYRATTDCRRMVDSLGVASSSPRFSFCSFHHTFF